jgi:hypothetical protein
MGVKKAEFDAHIEADEKVEKIPTKNYKHESVGIMYFLSFSIVY